MRSIHTSDNSSFAYFTCDLCTLCVTSRPTSNPPNRRIWDIFVPRKKKYIIRAILTMKADPGTNNIDISYKGYVGMD